ncbi:hypothetical protein GALMADRAFT_253916 [Galerina marginata CBS 339.88]|uniref:F-box domain-containing protein n=1 Tax=Galerina marginata (strain CBS 339.88) TaxID=685588 RepID=A0A067SNG6_GALM3|nr:hypothetical protein GALMADRAFT_253916 [Galerina marginata CBS 339.88]
MLAQLTDLPTELILQILKHDQIQPTDIYTVGLVCKRLNSIAISLLLEAQGVVNPENSIALTFDYDNDSLHPPQIYPSLLPPEYPVNLPDRKISARAAVMVAFYISSIREVKCTFPPSFTDLHILQQLERFAGFILCLKSIDSIAFHFAGDNQYRHLAPNPMFSSIFGDIIQTLTSKGCQSLQLYNSSFNDGQVERGVDPDDPTTLTAALSSFSVGQRSAPGSTKKANSGVLGISGGKIVSIPTANAPPLHGPTSADNKKGILKWTKARVGNTFSHFRSSKPPLPPKDSYWRYPPFNPSSTDPHGALHTVLIQTPFALLPGCLPAIRNIMHSSSSTLTRLTLSHIVLDEHLFDSCLPALFLNRPNAITHLSITQCHQISPQSFLRFLRCFQNHLQYLEFDREIDFISRDEELSSRLHFYELRTLKAPIDWVTYLLGADLPTPEEGKDPEVVSALPNLSALTIQCRTAASAYFTYQIFRPLLDNILEPLYSRWVAGSQYSQIPKIAVTLDLKLDRDQPWQMDQDRIFLNLLRPYLEPGHRKISSSHTTLVVEDGFSRTQASSTPTIPIHWQLIGKLELSPTPPPINSIQAGVLAQWVTTLFPAVEQVTLPLPFIPRSMPIAEYKKRQWGIANDAVVFLHKALRSSRIDDDAAPYAWKTLVIGQWSFSLDLDMDPDLESSWA